MNIEDIKVGKTYLLPFEVLKINDTDIHMRNGGVKGIFQPEELTEVSSPTPPPVPTGGMLHKSDDDWSAKAKNLFNLMTGTKNTETAPKYDPNRLFRKGDKVREVLVKGRRFFVEYPEYFLSEVSTVVIAEDALHFVSVKHPSGEERSYAAGYLELVTPVEELEPYSVVDAHTHWDVADKDMKTVATYSKGYHPHAKEAAVAERDRLNAEHRKEK